MMKTNAGTFPVRRKRRRRSLIQRFVKKNTQLFPNAYLRNQDDDFQHPDGYQQTSKPNVMVGESAS